MDKLGLSGGLTGNWKFKKSKYVLVMVQNFHTMGADLVVQTPG